ncbi:hypothetical protein H6G71_07390 [Arthrospira platensis FACHB-835]|nr:hypothetical protein [Arthrospira platensis FACHB-835]
MTGCGDSEPTDPSITQTSSAKTVKQSISEVSPPDIIQKLHPALDRYQPQVQIISPQPDELLQDNNVTVQLQVLDFPTFRDETLGDGPHLHLIIDNDSDRHIYNPTEPIILSDLKPGTHTLRVFAVYPWGESFKNDGSSAIATFHIYTKTPNNNPDPKLPLLTYNRPQGTYGAEPILLDFYLDNAPLHLIAQEDPEDEIIDWRIRVTVNGESFIIERWEPIYLKGFQPGKNWVQLEFLDELGEPLNNVYNNTARVLTYDPKSQDTLSKLIRGQLSLSQARGLVEANYTSPTLAPSPEIEEASEPEPIVVEEQEVSEPEPIVVEEQEVSEPEPIVVEEQEVSEPEPIVVEEQEVSEPEPIVVEEQEVSEPEPIVVEEQEVSEPEPIVVEEQEVSEPEPIVVEEQEVSEPEPIVVEEQEVSEPEPIVVEEQEVSEPELVAPREPLPPENPTSESSEPVAGNQLQKLWQNLQLPKFSNNDSETPILEQIKNFFSSFEIPGLTQIETEPGTPAALPKIVRDQPETEAKEAPVTETSESSDRLD